MADTQPSDVLGEALHAKLPEQEKMKERQCAICSSKVIFTHYMMAEDNQIKGECYEERKKRLLPIWQSKNVMIACCECFTLIKDIDRGHINDYDIEGMEVLQPIKYENLKKWGIIE